MHKGQQTRDFGPLAFDNNRFLLVLLLFLYNHICNELSDLDVPMKDKSAEDEATALKKLPFLFAAVIAIVALFSENGIFSVSYTHLTLPTIYSV